MRTDSIFSQTKWEKDAFSNNISMAYNYGNVKQEESGINLNSRIFNICMYKIISAFLKFHKTSIEAKSYPKLSKVDTD